MLSLWPTAEALRTTTGHWPLRPVHELGGTNEPKMKQPDGVCPICDKAIGLTLSIFLGVCAGLLIGTVFSFFVRWLS